MGQFLVAAFVVLLLLGGGAWFLFGPRTWNEDGNVDFSDRWGPIGGRNEQTDSDERDEEDLNYRGL